LDVRKRQASQSGGPMVQPKAIQVMGRYRKSDISEHHIEIQNDFLIRKFDNR